MALLAFMALAASRAQAQLPRLERILTIGCSSCDGAASFSEIAGIAIAPDGAVTVLDHGAPHVRVFARDGTVVTSFGRNGQGPGEFRTPSFLLPGPADTIDVVDVTNRRITRLSGAGDEVSMFPMREFPIAVAAAGSDGVVFFATTDFRTPTLAIDLWERAGEPVRMLRLSPDFPQRAPNQPSTFIALAASRDGRLAVGDGASEYRIRILDRHGRVLREITRDVERVERSAEEIAVEEARRERMRSRIQAMRQAESPAAPSRTAPAIPKLKSHFLARAFAFDPAGRLWVRTERGGLDDTVFDLFDGQGPFLGEVRIAARIGFFTLANGFLAGVTYDADEAQHVSLYRLIE